MFFKNKKHIDQYSDLELIDLFKKEGDNFYVGILFKRYTHLVFGVSLKYLKEQEQAKDITMQVFEKLLKDLKDHQIQNFKSWLHVLTKNECLMYLRKQKNLGIDKSVEITGNDFMEFGIAAHHVNDDGLENDLVQLENCIRKLKNEQKIAIKLFYLDKKCYDEICDGTGFDLKKVKSYIQNGRRNLKICIENSREAGQ